MTEGKITITYSRLWSIIIGSILFGQLVPLVVFDKTVWPWKVRDDVESVTHTFKCPRHRISGEIRP